MTELELPSLPGVRQADHAVRAAAPMPEIGVDQDDYLIVRESTEAKDGAVVMLDTPDGYMCVRYSADTARLGRVAGVVQGFYRRLDK